MTKPPKEKIKTGSSSLFAAYLANMNMPLSSHSKSINRERNPKVNIDNGSPIFGKDIPFQDNTKSELLIRYIAAEHEWFEDQTKSDISILLKNRLYTVKELRTLSKESWKQIELLPLVKDLIREMINHGKQLSAEEEYLKKKERRRERRSSRDAITSAINNNNTANINTNNINNTTSNEKILMNFPLPPSSFPPEKNETSNKSEVTRHIRYSSSTPQLQLQFQQSPLVPPKDLYNITNGNINNKNERNSKVTITKSTTKSTIKSTTKSTTTELNQVSKSDKVERFMPKPNKILVGEDRLKVKTDDGKFYEIDRYCPHAGSDLFSRGAVVGSKIICSKHYWAFSLEEGGKCVSGGKGTINACSINDW